MKVGRRLEQDALAFVIELLLRRLGFVHLMADDPVGEGQWVEAYPAVRRDRYLCAEGAEEEVWHQRIEARRTLLLHFLQDFPAPVKSFRRGVAERKAAEDNAE